MWLLTCCLCNCRKTSKVFEASVILFLYGLLIGGEEAFIK